MKAVQAGAYEPLIANPVTCLLPAGESPQKIDSLLQSPTGLLEHLVEQIQACVRVLTAVAAMVDDLKARKGRAVAMPGHLKNESPELTNDPRSLCLPNRGGRSIQHRTMNLNMLLIVMSVATRKDWRKLPVKVDLGRPEGPVAPQTSEGLVAPQAFIDGAQALLVIAGAR